MLVASNISVLRGDRLVLSGVDLAAGAGEALVLLGPNGAGKSTLLRVLAGLRRPDGGRVCWDGDDVRADAGAHARRVAYLGHQDALKPGLTAAQNLTLAAELSGGAVLAALGSAGVAGLADLPVRSLSAGQKRRVALARVALGGALWLLDEPTVGLDLTSVTRLAEVLAGHRRRGGIVIAATHLALPLPGAREMTL